MDRTQTKSFHNKGPEDGTMIMTGVYSSTKCLLFIQVQQMSFIRTWTNDRDFNLEADRSSKHL